MRICDICKIKPASYAKYVTIDSDGTTKGFELCGRCYNELRHREEIHKHQAYLETVKAVNGDIPRRAHWWHWFTWRQSE